METPTRRVIQAFHGPTGDTHMQVGALYTHEHYGLVLVTGVEFKSKSYQGESLYKVNVYLLKQDRHTHGIYASSDWVRIFKRTHT